MISQIAICHAGEVGEIVAPRPTMPITSSPMPIRATNRAPYLFASDAADGADTNEPIARVANRAPAPSAV